MSGSSPRVRGSQRQHVCFFPRDGIIPAGAGLTKLDECVPCESRDHPRGCGAHVIKYAIIAILLGSSPRVRGSLFTKITSLSLYGIIPAGAGLTKARCRSHPRSRDHPRGCGAHCVKVGIEAIARGSSPRVRGSRQRGARMSRKTGIIPAGAGLTSIRCLVCHMTRDHPRGCGAHRMIQCVLYRAMGSSPRVRGSQNWREKIHHAQGIIPAGAGLTSLSRASSFRCRDHPRGCGAHSGKVCRRARSRGIIPAGAGLTSLVVTWR